MILDDVIQMIRKQAFVAFKKLPYNCEIEYDDLVHEGVLKYFEIVESNKFDDSKGTKFITYFTVSLMNMYSTIVKNFYTNKEWSNADIGHNTSFDNSKEVYEYENEVLSNKACEISDMILNPTKEFEPILSMRGYKKRQNAISAFFNLNDNERDKIFDELRECLVF